MCAEAFSAKWHRTRPAYRFHSPQGAFSNSASVQFVTSLNRSRCFRLERPVTGRDSHPLESTCLFTAHPPTRVKGLRTRAKKHPSPEANQV